MGDVIDVVSTVASVIPGPWQAPALIYKGTKAASEGNILGVAGSAFGYGGLGGAGDLAGAADWSGGLSPEFGSFGGDLGSSLGSAADWGMGGDLGSSLGSNADWGLADLATGVDGSVQLPDWTKTMGDYTGSLPQNDLGNAIRGLSGGDTVSNSNFGNFSSNTGLNSGAAPNFGTTQNDVFNMSSPTVDTSGIGTSINPEISPDTYGDSLKTNTLEGLNSGQGLQDTGNTSDGLGFKPQSYTYENKDFLTGRTGTGMNADVSDLAPNFKQGSEMNNLPDIWKKLTSKVGSSQGVQATPLGLAGRGLSALYDMSQQGKAQDFLKSQMNLSNAWADQNSQRNQFAGNEWMKSQSDPMYGYDTFMRGAGGDFLNQARATAAKTGNRGSYLNSGRMNTDLANLWLKNQQQRSASLAGGFSQSNPYSGSNQLTAGYADMIKNKAAPLGQFANYASNFDLSNLWN